MLRFVGGSTPCGVMNTDLLGEIEEFLTGTRHAAVGSRRLATVLFTDIVGSTEAVRGLGDQAWRDRLTAMTSSPRDRYPASGRLVKTTGDGVLATFDGPAAAIHCAQAIGDAVSQIGFGIRCGIHVGEVEQRVRMTSQVSRVHTAQRICSAAQRADILSPV